MQRSVGQLKRQYPSLRNGLNGLAAATAAAGVFGLAANAIGQDVTTNSIPSAVSPSDPILNLLLEKGMITQDEAAKVQAQADAARTNEINQLSESGSKWKISDGIKSVELFGDVRLRYEDRKATDPDGGDVALRRLRYAVRLGLRGDAFDDFYYGVRVDTSSNPRSSWVTFGTSASGVPYQGPFGKSQAGINIGQVYLGWRPEPWLDVTAGKMPNPLYTTTLVWSPTINPEGAAEHFKYTVGNADFFANFAQFIYQDTNPEENSADLFGSLGSGYTGADQPFLLAWQGGVDYHITPKLDFKVAPVLYQYIGGPENTSDTSGTPGFGDTFVGQGAAANYQGSYYSSSGYYDGFADNQTGINDLLVLEVPFALDLSLNKFDIRLFGDYAQNLEGADRARAAYNASLQPQLSDTPITEISSPQIHDDVAYQVGLAIGSNGGLGLVNGSISKKHAWELRTYWQHVEQYALDPNLIDTDFFEGVENLQGVYFAAAYGLSDNMIATVRYGYASRINSKLGTGGSGQDIPQMNPIDQFNLLQVDLTFRF
jgi:hypothetical protein